MSQIVQGIFTKLPAYWKLATIKCAIYASIVGWGVFKAGVNGFEKLSDMTRLQGIELAGDVLMAMAAVWMAFIDQTISKVQDGQNLKVTDTVTSSREISAVIQTNAELGNIKNEPAAKVPVAPNPPA